ncbi:hypothetical protein [Leptospira vanthielii]|uniref:Ankyrin repeat domain-containing protein n=1 Tax=Leptospira vanthielii TaxID=293085 RepID=A0ABY2NKL8_9LEPT|nr:hypothetical protein [Leptospira vanthielii]TGM46210.1 hypothetical protein EHQ95_16320 [Leptospira vanthielii]
MKKILTSALLITTASCVTNRDLLQDKYYKNEKIEPSFVEQNFLTSKQILKKDGPLENSPIGLAASFGDYDTFQSFYKKVQDLSNYDKKTLLDLAVSIYRFGDNCFADCYEKRKGEKIKIIKLLLNSGVQYQENTNTSSYILYTAISSAFAEAIPMVILPIDKINKNENVTPADIAVGCYLPEEDMVYSNLTNHIIKIYDGKINVLKTIQSYGLKYKLARVCKVRGFEPLPLIAKKKKFIELALSRQDLIIK